MLGIHDLGLFIVAGLLLNVTPGPDTLYIVGRSATQGLRAGIVAALGIGAGCFVHIAAAAIGLSALILASAQAFLILKIVGAIYLLYVGATLLLTRVSVTASAPKLVPAPMRTVFWQGCLTNALNPKVALFFLAFLPQFIATDAPDKPLAFLVLGLIFDVNGTFWNLFMAWSSSRIAGGIARNARVAAWLNRAIGAFFVAIGVRLALFERG
jgi:threonine/homoserine/homoserine lactone efflux protein